MNEIKKFHDKLVSREDLGLWQGDVSPILDEVDKVDLRWKGGKIPPRIIRECLTWFRMVNAKYSSEAQARLGYNPKTGEWCWVAFPQLVCPGLYSKEIPSDELTDEQRAMRVRATREMSEGGFMECGTIHSHCDAGAFASGIDDKDEISQNGIHITLGRITSEEPEIHGRVVFRRIKYPIHWADWLEAAPADLPESFHFTAKEAPIDEERLMGLCFERQKPDTAASRTKWPAGGWGLCGSPSYYGRQGLYDQDNPGYDPYGGTAGRSRRWGRGADADLEELVDRTVEDVFYGHGFDEDALLEFVGTFCQRIVELDICPLRDVVSTVVDGILEGREGPCGGLDRSRETETGP